MITLKSPSKSDIDHAIEILCRSQRGVQAISNVLGLLDEGATSLDAPGKSAVLTLVTAGFGVMVGTAIEKMRFATRL